MNTLAKEKSRLQEELGLTFDRERRLAFWDSMRSWFVQQGYTPYERIYDDGEPTYYTRPTYPNLPPESKFPYARLWKDGDPPCNFYDGSYGHVICAQDAQGRHVTLKLIKDGTEEYRVNRFLFDLCRESSGNLDSFNNVIPVLDLIPIEDHWFVVMPRWGMHPHLPDFFSVKDLLQFIHSLLKGLNFLHKNNIFHGDISPNNLLTNDLSSDLRAKYMTRSGLRFHGLLVYAIFDFNCSVMFPRTFARAQCRLPYTRSWRGTPWYMPADTTAGEFDFDPFAWDVGALGIFLCRRFQQYTPVIPVLAPLLDMMVTWDVPRRFTSSEALGFLERVQSEMTEDQLSQVLTGENQSWERYDEYDRWKDLSTTFIQKWGHYRGRPLPWTKKLMRMICGSRPWVLHIVAFLRRSMHAKRRKIILS